ncbi:tRNA (adenosine(37)-N6)-threonylcarbamoyltransferase complex dimerization subunit type 1 TsaB [Sphingorhabdus pulchriflava]|uniref:tRNA (Adenosine(37)-N6)-threonylcarbamoyltransferase complex dimerization subunit type 1 TsaB n=1 Tax=Sphingorhabdus pulchriflava TaxID=2292257 RepID=A0A371BIY5_9SPHN|nr:tRNA (adenosine(37)-N6)-threonylcarbamoyltransferase complex dimerization subunit type 1 TsaB [Sphingorhabdus pulchriflava]RDV07497.1 tRNA (adenosine(37)-N6)-threonylcarbamoyltransferase complex dimerization subunit type 1 TsaB [Sphingorhabdus pulchriflava]
MRRLVIDTATRACSVALFEDMECIAACHEVIGRGHAERLVPMIAELPEKGLADILSVNVGPGSFTGIRVGVSAAKALALAWNVRCQGYNGLALMAAIARQTSGSTTTIDVAVHGGHGELFFQSFAANGSALSAPQSLVPDAVAQLSTADTIVGDAADLVAGLRGSGAVAEAVSDARHWPLIEHLGAVDATPTYVRGPDAKLPKAK